MTAFDRLPGRRQWLGVAVLSLGLCATDFALAAPAHVATETETVEAVPSRIRPHNDESWPVGDPRTYGYDALRLDEAIDRIGEQDGIYGVLVVRQGQLLAERYFREGRRGKGHNLKSSSKSIISALIGILIEDGKLRLDDSVVERLNVRGVPDDRDSITVRDLLRMASGLQSTSYEAYGAWIASSDWVKSALALPLVDEPGTRYSYSTANTHLLSALVRQASGMSTRAFAEQRLFDPLGIEVLGWETDPKGIHIGGNNLALLPRDMARFGQLYLRNGKWEGTQLVPRAWIEESTRVRINSDHEVYGDYGYQWFIPTGAGLSGDFVAVGFGGQYIYVAPRLDTVVVITSTLESKGRDWERSLFGVLQGELLAEGPVLLTSNQPEASGADPTSAARATRYSQEQRGEEQATAEGLGPATREVAQLRQELTAAITRNTSLLKERNALQEQVEALAEQVSAQSAAVAALESQIQEERVNDAESRAARAQELVALRQQVERGSAQVEALETERLKWRVREDELGRAASRAQELQAGVEAHASERNAWQLERERLQRELQLAGVSIEEKSEALVAMELIVERSNAAQRRLAQQTETEVQAARGAEVEERERLTTAFDGERQQLRAQLASERSRADQALAELQQARQEQQASEQARSELSSELATAADRAQQAELSLSQRGGRIETLQAEIASLRAAAASVSADRLAEGRELVAARLELEQARTEATALATEVDQARQALAEKAAMSDQLVVAERTAAVADRTVLLERAEAAEFSLLQREERIKELQVEVESLSAEVSKVATDSAAMQTQLSDSQAQGERTQRELQAVVSELEEARTALARSRTTSEQSAVNEAQAAAARRGLEEQRLELEARVARAQESAEQGQRALRATESAVQELRDRLVAERKASASAQAAADSQHQAQTNAMAERLADTESQVERLRLALADRESAAEASGKALADSNTELTRLRQELVAAETEAAGLRDEMLAVRTTMQNAGRQVNEELRDEARALNEAVQAAVRRAEIGEEQAETARTTVATLERQLTESRARLAQVQAEGELLKVAERSAGVQQSEAERATQVALKEADARVRAISQELAAITSENATLRDERTLQQARLDDALADQERADGRAASLESRVEQLQAALAESEAVTLAEPSPALGAVNVPTPVAAATTATDEREVLLERLSAREESISRLREEIAAGQDRAASNQVEGLQSSYAALVRESELLAQRGGEQAQRIASLERRLAANNVADRQVRALVSEIDRLLSDRRVGETVRRDLVRLRALVLELVGTP